VLQGQQGPSKRNEAGESGAMERELSLALVSAYSRSLRVTPPKVGSNRASRSDAQMW